MKGRLLQILSLRRGANSKRGAYLKLGANSSIYGKPIDIAVLSAVSVVRIRKKLPPDEVKTVGGGCIVKWMLGGSESSLKQSAKSSVFLLTTTQVISKNDLIASNGSISVELLDGDKTVSFNLGDKCGTDLLEPLPGEFLEEPARLERRYHSNDTG